jgi:hypothetical protein
MVVNTNLVDTNKHPVECMPVFLRTGEADPSRITPRTEGDLPGTLKGGNPPYPSMPIPAYLSKPTTYCVA